MITISLSKFKGGVAGTETAYQLATIYALAGWRVLVVDTDPQGGITKRFFSQSPTAANLPTLADAVAAFIADRKNPAIRLSQVVRLAFVTRDARKRVAPSIIAVVPADRALQDQESAIGNMPVGRTKVLKRMLATVADQYDICLIDTPPVFGYLSRNAVVAANGLLLPLLPEPLSFDALAELRSELAMMAEEDEIPAIVGTVANRYSEKSHRHAVGKALLQIAARERTAEDLQCYNSAVEQFNLASVEGLSVPFLGTVANDNGVGNERNLRKTYEPIALRLAKEIGFVLDMNLTKEVLENASISA